ncbi:bifunctional folylpolyglutamate synthase/dihydrofolate synthase [Salidesulfovibrio onnuriiensis]|uniref:bifunctional folylpolyglutamate synthase/dihydrofolate synthase n=1 Tax=Salidesulfovibrio onnuriiensis TaxID=2583823 RepID=UPI00202B0B62|nr:Mur ligase family protein [Salidesulfovibrio onnuriiensis]
MAILQTYNDVRAYMDRLGLFSMDLGLGRMESFWAGHHAPSFPIVHVVGTNGKGSTSTFFESVAREHGLRTGLFTSPHFVTPRERIKVDGRMLSREDWLRLANQVLETPGGDTLTYFEFQTCLAMLAFMDKGVDVAIMEAGMGGRYDATNVFSPQLTLFTPIGLDHEKVLGSTINAIAQDKAGAMHADGVAVTGGQEPEAFAVLQGRARALGIEFHEAREVAEEVASPLGLRGEHQRDNARLAVAGWRLFAGLYGVLPDDDAMALGMEQAFIPGRLHMVRPEGMPQFILDGAHNHHALVALGRELRHEGIEPDAIVFNCMADKTLDAMLPLLRGFGAGPILCPGMAFERAAAPEDTARAIGDRAVAYFDLRAALEPLRGTCGVVLICGSLYLLASFYELYPEFLRLKE